MAKIILGPWDTEGRRLLSAFLESQAKNGRGQGWLAGVVGVSQPTISDWKAGKKRPEGHHRSLLQALAEIPEAAWLTPEETEALGQAMERLRAERIALAAPLSPTGTDGA